MIGGELDQRLSRMATQWSVVFQAHQAQTDAAGARGLLMQRYSGAAYRYLLGAVRDPDVAADLCQEFAVRFLRGDFHRAAPERGRFRDYLKTALVHLVTDHHRARQAWPQGLPADPAAALATPTNEEADRTFLKSWRAELLDRTWKALAAEQPTYHAVLQLRIADPELPSTAMAERLTGELGKPMSPANVRKALQRAHERFADLLLDEIACSLGTSGTHELRAELTELDLLKYCGTALQRRESS